MLNYPNQIAGMISAAKGQMRLGVGAYHTTG
jgi:hypothetical protein